ncbi:hypothetical protein LIER_07358 [Lithospermum erythrorhizon]|uniref:Uncharacterized protein n=1 Tax=Lithospermum erythrorhizon TaxID=34254 RepID=A0AAV3P7Z0_LITER
MSSRSGSIALSSSDDTNWLSTISYFNPLFYDSFSMYKTLGLLCILEIVDKNVKYWNYEVEGKIKDFTNMIYNKEEQNNSHFLIFGPWINMSEFPANIDKLLKDKWISGFLRFYAKMDPFFRQQNFISFGQTPIFLRNNLQKKKLEN